MGVTMPPTTPYAGKFSTCAAYSSNNNNHAQPHSPYRSGTAPRLAKENLYNGAYSAAENPYDIPQPHGSYRSSSVSSATAKEHHYTSSCAVSENPYSPPAPQPQQQQPRSPRQHSSSCPGRAYRHTTAAAAAAATSSSSCSSSEQSSCRNTSAAGKARLHGHGITASYGEMCYHDNSLVSASLEALIQHLVPTVDYYPDRSYVFTFLLSSRLFLHPYELMTRVCHLCVEQQRSGDALLDKIRFREVAPKLVQLLTEWTETFPYDFRDDRMMRCLKDMTHHVARGDEYSWRAMQQMTQRLIKRLSALGQYEEAVAALNAVATERPASLKSKQASGQRGDVLSTCDDPFVLAQQLTHIELDRLSFIGPEEFIQTFAMKDPLENHKGFFRKRKTSNLEAYVNWFNRLSYLVATEICMPVKKKHRARIIEFFIDVAQECFNIGNFNSLMAIITGMNMSPIARLRKTWSKVNTDKFEILEHQMDPSSNFSNYRTALRGATQRSETAHSSQEKIVIPFFSLLIKDIYFLNEGCASRLANGHINFEKLWELAKQVSEFLVWRQVICPFDRDRRILQYLVTTPVFSEDELHLASYESEGPENNMEKDSRRSLRSSLSHRENRS
ncbi:putative ras-GEF domain-containing family member 1B-B-like [Scophthalmus maximus]|uniref:Putative ras-GEF domain-containing family member 1B-B-like n=1 Tax=Scophthalmus maximus TaxID=52904 RepID=A0A2U9CH45_SCOMX|nr:putative ras-GEF domain-containing family member 1B-B-like [Scophthalmus maximus]